MRRLILFCLFLSAVLLHSCSDISEPPPLHVLETNITPLNSGRVSPDSGEFEEGDHIEIKAEADSGYVFAGWSGDLTGEANPDSLYFDSDKQVTAVFEEKMYSLNIEVDGWGSVHEEVVNSKTDYPEGTVLELTADPRNGWEFSHWEMDIEGEENPVTITIVEEKTVKAVFVEEEEGESDGGDGNDGDNGDGDDDNGDNGNGDDDNDGDNGDGDDDNDGDNGDGDDDNDGDNGDGDDDNDGDNGDGDDDNDGDNDGETNDPLKTFTISIDTDGEGTVSLEPDKEEYEEGERVKAKANPENGWKFSHWNGDLTGKGRAINFTIEKDIQITAVFEEKKRD